MSHHTGDDVLIECDEMGLQEDADVDMQDLGSMRAAMLAMERQLAELKAQREAAEAEQVRTLLAYQTSRG